ncbi:hypothetical protein [Azohydromonas lata]|uniref:Uncharacterized protein n=1 Tax=Azohydromonas lata TaxID=45677 RepID=A0ABU5I9L4_9BURK|nr:hypothetical protein [Azohydromonas lata]MDZ5455792.1 hypothetical protein [Azohydromonas lata]
MEINSSIAKHIRFGSGDSWAASAIISERGITYVKYDAIRIGNATDVNGGVSLQFLWQGVAAAWVRIDSAMLTREGFKTTEKMEGRLKI